MRRRNLREPATLQRSPTLTKGISEVRGSRSSPLSCRWRGRGGTLRGRLLCAAWANRAMKAGSVPQQPPTMFTRPRAIISSIRGAMVSAFSSYPPRALGRPALGYTDTKKGAFVESSSTNGSICRAPNEQFSPTERRGNPLTLARKASSVCPLRVRPARSLSVTESMRGTSRPTACMACKEASMAALALRVSKMVSMSTVSTPPRSSASVCSW